MISHSTLSARTLAVRIGLVLMPLWMFPHLSYGQELPSSCTNFTDNPLVVGMTAIKAIHITQLRTCIAALRSQRSMSTYTWTDPTLTSQQTLVKAVHITELRSALNQVYVTSGATPPTYGGTLTSGVTVVQASHISSIRSAIAALPGCSYSVTPSSPTVSAANGQITFYIDTQSGCDWEAEEDDNFLELTTDDSGSGDGSVTYSIENNTSQQSRTAQLDIATHTITVTQLGTNGGNGPCEPEVSASRLTFSQGGGEIQIDLIANSGCQWSIQSGLGWLSVSPSSGTGPATVTLTTSENGDDDYRLGFITANGLPILVVQSGTDDDAVYGTADFTDPDSPPEVKLTGGTLTCIAKVDTGSRNRVAWYHLYLFLDGQQLDHTFNAGHQYTLTLTKTYQASSQTRTARCDLIDVGPPVGLVRRVALSIPPQQTTVCMPNIQWTLRSHKYIFSANELWPGFEGTVHDARSEWNTLVSPFTSTAAFDFSTGVAPTLTVDLNENWIGTTTWGQTDPSQTVLWLNPDNFGYGYSFAKGIVLHEFGHARGYGHVPTSCAVTDSIMYEHQNPNGTYPQALGPGDTAAAQRDIKP